MAHIVTLLWSALSMIGIAESPPAAAPAPPPIKLYPIYRQKKWGFMDRTGRILVPPTFECWDDPCSFEFWKVNEGLGRVPVLGDGLRWGYVDPTGRMVIPPRFDGAQPFRNGFAQVSFGDYSGQHVSGFIDTTGQFIFHMRGILILRNFDESGFALIQRKGKRFRVDRTGQLSAAPPLVVSSPDGDLSPSPHSSSWYGGIDGTFYGYRSPEGEYLIAPQFTSALAFYQGLALVCIDKVTASNPLQWACIDRHGDLVVPPFADAVQPRTWEGKTDYAYRRNGQWGFFVDGKIRVMPRYDEVSDMQNGLWSVRQGERWSFIDNDYRPVPDDDPRIYTNHKDGLWIVRVGDKSGFQDAFHRIVIPAQWTSVTPFEDGVAQVRIGWTPHINGWINTKGEYLWKPQE